MKGFFTQSACILADRHLTLAQLTASLSSFDIAETRQSTSPWFVGGDEVIVGFRPEKNGYVQVDIVNRPWPDTMGDPEADKDLFAAWAMGFFGPFAYPGNLARATQQSWYWEEGKTVPLEHRSFIRIRCGYSLNAGEEALVVPDDYDPLNELIFVTDVAEALLAIPGALCYFNPNGETVRSPDFVRDATADHRRGGPPPVELWSNIRLFNVDPDQGWLLMDSIGLRQLDLDDFEACFIAARYGCVDVDVFLRNLSLYLLEQGKVIGDGDTATGPGEVAWRTKKYNDSLVPPPRPVMRWFPEDETQPPEALLSTEALG